MKNKLNYLMLGGVALASMLSACSESAESTPELTPQIESPEHIAIGADTGEHKIVYTVKNSNDNEVSAASDVNWIHSVSAAVPGEISFSVYENEDAESRQGNIILTCGSVERAVKVYQEGKNEMMSFQINVEETTQSAVRFKVTPSADGESYLALVTTRTAFDKFEDDEACYQSDLAKFEKIAEQQEISLSDLLAQVLVTEEHVFPLSGLNPETDYVIYVYVLTAEGIRTTPIAKEQFKTGEKTAASFDIEVAIDNYTANVTVVPSDNSLPFYSNIIDAERYDALGGKMPDAAKNELTQLLNILTTLGGMSKEEAVASQQRKDKCAYSKEIFPSTEYIVFAYVLSDDGAIVSDIATYSFTTEASGNASALTFQYNVTDITTDAALITYQPSDPTCMYYFGVANSDDTAESIKEGIIAVANSGIKIGVYKDLQAFMRDRCVRGTHTSSYYLQQEVVYRPYAIGVAENGSFATDVIFGEEFRPKENQWSEHLRVEVGYDIYFNGNDLKKLNFYLYGEYEDSAAVPIDVHVEGDYETYYFTGFYNEEYLDVELHPDEEMIPSIKLWGREKGDKKLMALRWDTPCILFALAVDKDGKYSNVSRKKILCTKDGAADVSEFDPDSMFK